MAQATWKRLLAGLARVCAGTISDPGLFRVHAAAALGRKPYGARRPGRCSGRRPVRLARHASTKSDGVAARAGTPGRAIGPRRWSTWATAAPPWHRPGETRGQSLLARRAGRPRRPAAARALRGHRPAGPFAHPGRQGPRALDALRRQRARAGAGLLEGLFHGPGREMPAEEALGLLPPPVDRGLWGSRPTGSHDLHKAGFRILPGLGDPSRCPTRKKTNCRRGRALSAGRRATAARRAISADVPPFWQPARRRFAGRILPAGLRLLPFPGSLVFWGAPPYVGCAKNCPWPCRFRCCTCFRRHEQPHEHARAAIGLDARAASRSRRSRIRRAPLRNTYRRTHRWARIHRHEDELAVADGEDRMAHVLFSTAPDDMGFMASRWPATPRYGRTISVSCWTARGPTRKASERAADGSATADNSAIAFFFPAMQVGRHEVYWHRPLVACLAAQVVAAEVVLHAPLGYLTAYAAVGRSRPGRELWPRLLARPPARWRR